MIDYLLLRDNLQSGPYSLDELKSAGIRSTDMLWIEGKSKSWLYPDEMEELQAYVHVSANVHLNNQVARPVPKLQHKSMAEDLGTGDRDPSDSPRVHVSQIESGEKKREEREGEGQPGPGEGNNIIPFNYRYAGGKKPLNSREESDNSRSASGAGEQESHAGSSSTAKVIQVIIADDHTLFREGVKMALSQKTDVKIVGEAENGMQLLHLLKHNLPDVILLDIQMPVMDGISALTSIRNRYGDIKVIMLSMYNDPSMVTTLMETGANAYLTKTADSESIYEAIKTCYTKSYYFNDLTNMSMLERIRSLKNNPDKTPASTLPAAPIAPESSKPVPTRQVFLKESSKRGYRKLWKRLLLTGGLTGLLIFCVLAVIPLLRHNESSTTDFVIGEGSRQDEPASAPFNSTPPAAVLPVKADSVRSSLVSTDSASMRASTIHPAVGTDSLVRKMDPVHVGKPARLSRAAAGKTRTEEGMRLPQTTPIYSNKPFHPNELRNPAEPKQDSGDSAASLDSTARGTVGLSDYKKMIRKNLSSLLWLSPNKYQVGPGGGISHLELTLINRTVYTMNQVTVEIQYLRPDSGIYKTERVSFVDIPPLSSKKVQAPVSSGGVKAVFRILSVKSTDLAL